MKINFFLIVCKATVIGKKVYYFERMTIDKNCMLGLTYFKVMSGISPNNYKR